MADEKVDSLFFRMSEASHRLAFVTPSRDRGPNNLPLHRQMYLSRSGVVRSPDSRNMPITP